jgi:hypothetical protein
MLERKQRKKKVRNGNLILAKAKAAIELKKSCPATTTLVTNKEFKKNRPNGAFFHASVKFTIVICLGNNDGGYVNISVEGFNAVSKVQSRGNIAQNAPTIQKI